MQPKPSHLSGEYGAWFKDPRIAAAYPARPAYPAAVIQLLADLVVDTPRVVLDLGCGTGDIARHLAPLVDRVDAVDFSSSMIEQGQRLAGGAATNLRWILAAVEDAPLDVVYALVTADESLHWMAWDVVLPRCAAVLPPTGAMAIIERYWDGPPSLLERLRPIFVRYSPVRDFRTYNLVDELTHRRLFEKWGEQRCGPEPWSPSIDDYLECRHSQRGFSRTHMGAQAASAFDTDVRQALEDLNAQGAIAMRDGRLQLTVDATVTWGKPLRPEAFGPPEAL
ncbi:MAG: class I SAM-dependent methyltransferase [Chloroflexota bacterium]|nr:class I SAM-dependent methyltransferase [Chloroflexota bacterium]